MMILTLKISPAASSNDMQDSAWLSNDATNAIQALIPAQTNPPTAPQQILRLLIDFANQTCFLLDGDKAVTLQEKQNVLVEKYLVAIQIENNQDRAEKLYTNDVGPFNPYQLCTHANYQNTVAPSNAFPVSELMHLRPPTHSEPFKNFDIIMENNPSSSLQAISLDSSRAVAGEEQANNSSTSGNILRDLHFE